jgi:hypothetical protein
LLTRSDIENQREFLVDLAKQFGIKQYEDWYSISKTKVINAGGLGLLKNYNGSLPQGWC